MFGRIARLATSGFWNTSVTPTVQTVVTTGATQAAAAPVTADVVITSGGTATTADGIVLPKAQKGDVLVVRNTCAFTLDVWPAVGDTINALSANAVYTGIGTGKSCVFVAQADGAWFTVLSA